MSARKSCRKFSFAFLLFRYVHHVSSLVTSKGDGTTLLAKTKETFKLADLQYLEAKIQSKGQYECTRLLVDAATGSSLFLLNRFADDFEAYILGEDHGTNRYDLPTSLRSCEWVGEVLCNSASAEELIHDLSIEPTTCTLKAWTLDYLRMTSGSTTSSQSGKTKAYTKKTLCCCVAQKLAGEAALNPNQAVDKLVIVETCESMFLVKLLHFPLDRVSTSPIYLTQKKWAQRPFPYSSATNFPAAEMVINMLAHRVSSRAINKPSKPNLLDATCGSGTFLALAMTWGMQVTGWDSNPRCVEGSQRNLQYAFGSTDDFTVLHRNCLDIPLNLTQTDIETFDAVASNLPWGLNSNMFSDEREGDKCTSSLLLAIRNVLKPGIPCVFLYKDEDESGCNSVYWEQIGYKVIGHASIPQKNFVLPKGGKKERKKLSEERALTGRSDCIALAVRK
ncbi:hypothetical protein FisN_12Hh203 [Fistulifera solaris]|uniref:Uncharacterized protein n=1 Tax=Fistulifera solaris TaxID=1519565 RepID=A0A1Z5KBG1_FISSO|nr:hypothetical protein FisN_12Hh203 [Fistulifera solaris]|eukprot:GAX23630.1 hypothetical protein FisN_12Hh203 [Fistulifera solaris]